MQDLDDIAEVLSDYEIGQELGRGQSGIVWRGRHRQLDREVAIKQLAGPASAEHAERFRREARILARVDHPHVVTVYDYREREDLRLLVMEVLSGGTFADEVAAGLSTEAAVAATVAAASGLHHVHEQGILHRDVKPENLMFNGRGALKVTDFGIARLDVVDTTVTSAGQFFGTPAYVAPEQALHALGDASITIGPAADQYSLAAVLYEALSGQLTHDAEGGALALCNRRIHEEPRPLRAPDVPDGLAAVIMKALARDPRDRYPSVEAFAHVLVSGGTEGDAAPLPSRVKAAAGGTFAGREHERSRFAEAWKSAAAGERRLWLVGGEAGIGKTALSSQLATDALGRGGQVAYGRFDDDLGVPYQAWIEALSTLVTHASRDAITDHLAARGGVLARLVPELSRQFDVQPPDASDEEAERFALFGAVTDLLARCGSRVPLLVVLDDLHWADKPSVQLLRHLARVSEPMHVLVVATYRPTDLGSTQPLAEALPLLRREQGVDFIDLNGLDDLELLELIEATAGHELGEDGVALRDAIAAETNGSPFFANEVLRHLLETGAVVEREGRWTTPSDLADVGLPVSVRQVVGERVARLGTETERILRTAAVIGRDFDLDLLVEVADVDEDEALDLLDAAVDAALVHNVAPDRYSFAHALVQHALYDDLTASRRGRLHRRIAQTLEAQCGDDPGSRVGELAHHWSSAVVPDDTAKAIEYAWQAGERALNQLAPDEAARWFTHGLELQPDGRDDERQRVRLLVGLGTAQRQAADPAHRATLLEAAQRASVIGDRDLLVAAALANHRGWASLTGTIDEERLAVLNSALAAVGPDDTAERARLLATIVAELTFADDLTRRRAIATEAVEVARLSGDEAALVAALIGHLSLPDRPDWPARTVCDEVLELSANRADFASLAPAAASGVTSAVSFADRERLDRCLTLCDEAATRVGQPELVLRAIGAKALAAMVNGDLVAAEGFANELLPHAAEMGFALLYYGSIVIAVRGHQGRGGEIREVISAVAADPQNGSAAELARVGLLMAHLQAGDVEAAREGFELEAAADFSTRDDALLLTHLGINAHLCARLGDSRRAEMLLPRVLPYIDLVATNAAQCLFSFAACAGALTALLGRDGDADDLFAHALELTTSFGAPYLVATAQLEWATALARRDDADLHRASAFASDAFATARKHGYGEIERESKALQAKVMRA